MALDAQFVFNEIEKGIKADPSYVQKVGGVLFFKIGSKSWTIDLKNAPGSVKSGPPSGSADCTITVDEENFIKLMTGQANGQQLFMQGKLKLQGNMALAMKLDKLPKAQAPSSAPAAATAPSAAPAASSGSFRAAAVFDELTKKIAENPALVQQIGGVYQFQLTGPGGVTKSWTVDLKSGKGSVSEGKAEKADVTLITGDDEFVGMMTGKANSQQLFMQGKLKIQGNMGLAMKLNKLQSTKASL